MRPVNYYKDLFLTSRFFVGLCLCIVGYIVSYYYPNMWHAAVLYSFIFLGLVVIDFLLLFGKKQIVELKRTTEHKFSNGDNNDVKITINNNSRIPLSYTVIDELPEQFGIRDFELKGGINSFAKLELPYQLRPTKRGEYIFEDVIALLTSPISLLERRVRYNEHKIVKVYPSFLQIRNKQLRGVINDEQIGETKMKRLASSMEFDHIKEYAQGDDIRTLNWKATARKGTLMVNTYMDERSQQIFIALDMGRVMKMPFEGLSLLDHSINAALMLSFTILNKNDKVGLITFNERNVDFVKPEKTKMQLAKVTDALYKQKTDYLETNFEALYNSVKYQVGQRSLIMLFTNFETMSALDRVMPYLKAISKKHLLSVIIFENTEIKNIHSTYKNTMEGIYVKTIADRFYYEKKRIVKELSKEGILSIFTAPQNLTSNVVNQYLDLKTKRII